MVIDLDIIQKSASSLTVVGILLIDLVAVVVGLQRRWWIPGFIHAERMAEKDAAILAVTKDRDEWKATALRGFDLTEAAVGGIRHVARKS